MSMTGIHLTLGITIIVLMVLVAWLGTSLSKCGKELSQCGEEGWKACEKAVELENKLNNK